jgi:hypothetical protein
MRGDPRRPRPETDEISTAPPPRREIPDAAPAASRSRHPKPEVLMGEVAGPRGQEIGAGRDALRAFMLSRRLAPTRWARDAGVPMSEILAYLTGGSRQLSAVTAAKLAEAAGVAPEELFAARKNGGP